MNSVDLHIEGMTCAACSSRIEKVINKIPGAHAEVSLLEHRARVSGLTMDDAIAAIRRAGYDAWPVSAPGQPSSASTSHTPDLTLSRAEQFRLWLSVLALIPMSIEMGGMLLGRPHLIPLDIQWALATVMQTFVAWPFYVKAWRALRVGSATMETLITIGTVSAYLWSMFAWWSWDPHANHGDQTGAFYFETSIVVLAMVRLGRHLEQKARQRALDALAKLAHLDAAPVEHWRDGQWIPTLPNEIVVGERIRLHPNQAIHLDAVITEGQTEVDESSLSGESMPAVRGPGEMIFAGCTNLSGVIVATVSQRFDQSRRAKIGQRILSALSSRAPIAAMADRVAGIFVPVVMVIAVVTFFGHWITQAGTETALANAVAVLVVACPCALGLATPAAIATGLARAAQFGWLFRSADALQRAAEVDHVIFDKTGTLTSGRAKLIAFTETKDGACADASAAEHTPRTIELEAAHAESPWPAWLADAAGAERGVEHPLAGALLSYAAGRPMTACHLIENFPGLGVHARSDTTPPRDIHVGRPGWIDAAPTQLDQHHPDASAIDVCIDQQWAGRLWVADSLRPDAVPAIAILRHDGIHTSILSGDRESAVARVAGLLSGMSFMGGRTPEAKAELLDQWRGQHKRVAMVGDGINDAAAMAHAHLGIAMASGASLTLETADLTVSNASPLLASAQSLALARAVLRRVKENLVFAFGFNALAIPLAAFGALTPVLAGTAMALSSAAVMLNATRLLGWKPRAHP